MTQISEREACTKRSWYMGGGIGLLVAFVMLAFGGAGLIKAIIIGALVAVIAGYLLMTFLCKDAAADAPQDNTRSAAAASTASAPTASGSVSSATGTVPAGDAGIGAAERASGPVTPKPDQPKGADQSAPVADTKAVAEDAAAPKPETGRASETADAPIADTANVEETPAASAAPAARSKATASATKAMQETPTSKPGDLPAQDVHSAATAGLEEPQGATIDDPDVAPVTPPKATPKTGEKTAGASEEKPPLLDTARAEGADDLKRIGGIGPKMEQTLNDLGIYHFDQLAQLSDEEIAWVDSRLRFKGRIERDNWVGQAKALADASESQS